MTCPFAQQPVTVYVYGNQWQLMCAASSDKSQPVSSLCEQQPVTCLPGQQQETCLSVAEAVAV